MPEPTEPNPQLEFVQQRITQLREFFTGGGEADSITTDDGQSISFNRAALREELQMLEEQERRLTGKRRWIRKIDMT